MASHIERRKFLATLGGAAVAWPLAARAQQAAMPVIGILGGTDVDDRQLGAIRQGLREAGFSEGRNVAIEYRWAQGRYDRLPELAADLARRNVAVIVAIQGTAPALAAKAATSTIPIVFSTGGDAVKLGLVVSLNRPGANVTGVSFLVNALGAKRLELLRTLVPTATVIGFLVNPDNPNAEPEVRDMREAAHALGQQIHILNANSEQDIDADLADFVHKRIDALITAADAFFLSRRDQLTALAASHAMPAIYHVREIAAAGGLMSYGTSIVDAYRQSGLYVGRILKGEKPADLPVAQSAKFELVINLKTAKALGLQISDKLIALADEVIE
jgi:putative ABC transport system substrate-binding protein